VTIAGRQISITVLIAFVVSLIATVGGAWVAIANQWGKTDPGSLVVLIAGALALTITTAVHAWDTGPGQPSPVPPKPPVA
jgi:hypothetical protein